MLVLCRKIGEQIVVPPHEIVITVLEVLGNKVRLGITAPPHVPIHRHEVWARLRPGTNGKARRETAGKPR